MKATVTFDRSGEWVEKRIDTGTPPNNPAVEENHLPYRMLRVALEDGELINDGTDGETVTIEVLNGLEIVKGTDPTNATVLDYNGDVTLTVDGAETAKTLSSGSVSFDITTTKSAGETIEVVAETLTDHPAESDSATIEVIE